MVRMTSHPAGAALEERRPRRAEHEQRLVAQRGGQRLDGVERAVVGPVEVFEEQEQRPAGRGGAEVGRHLRQRQAAQLARIALQGAHVGAGAKVVAEQVANQMGRHLGCVVAQQGAEAFHQFFAHGRRLVVVEDAAAKDEHVAQQAEGQLLCLLTGASAVELDVDRLQVAPVLEFIEQARLAQPGLADDGDDAPSPLLDDGGVDALQVGQLGVAADHPRFDAFDAAPPGAERARLGPQDAVDGHWLVKAAHLYRW